MIIKPFRGAQLDLAHPLSQGLVGCWLMNEGVGNKIYDLSGNELHMDAINNPTWTPSGIGDAHDYVAASTQYHVVNKTPVATYPMTLLVWANPDDIVSNYALLWVGDKDTDQLMTGIRFAGGSGGDPVGAFSYNSSAKFYEATTSFPFIANKWQQVVGVFPSDTSRTPYLDGVPGTEDTRESTPADYDRIAIGTIARSSIVDYMDGLIGLAMIWDRALSEFEIKSLYRDPYQMFAESVVAPWFGGLGVGVGLNILDFERGTGRGASRGVMRGVG